MNRLPENHHFKLKGNTGCKLINAYSPFITSRQYCNNIMKTSQPSFAGFVKMMFGNF